MILNENNNLNQENILVRELESPEKIEVFSEVDDWSKMLNEARIYGEKNQIDLINPYDNLFSAHANMEIRHKLIDKLELSHLDKSDYAIAAGAGILAGIVDAVFVGTIGKGGDVSKLQGWTDDQYEKIVSTFASNASAADQINKLDKNKLGGKEYDEAKKRILKSVREKSHSTNVSYLEDRFKVLYDTTGGRNSKLASGGVVSGMNTGNHHILSLAHDPGPLGLVFSVIDQLTGKATFIENGKIIREATQSIVNSSYNEDQFSAFYESTLEPIALQLSLEFTRKVFNDREQTFGNSICFESGRLIFSSNATKVNMIKELVPLGLLSINQALEILNLPSIPDGDKRLQTLNVVDATKAEQYQLGGDEK